ncbi:tetratricopeptide repeat-containing serine/threonine-protein kinase [Paraburkholderia xenovorans]|uniref:protein kinase family protein n=1 Tax=Paraburkholderia xenovorans TaxID=36873 RepID=UPI0038B74FAF
MREEDFEISAALTSDAAFGPLLARRWPAAAGKPYPMAEQKLPRMDEQHEFKTFEINGRWQVIGARSGSMGSAYLCVDKAGLWPTVVCKRPLSPRDRESHLRECQLLISLTWRAGVSSAHVVEVIDIDSNFPGSPNIVLEAVLPGPSGCMTVADWIEHELVTDVLASAWIDHIATALLHCREIVPGFVHADLKPDNILVAPGYICKIADFGLSGWQDSPGVAGAPLYRAPELWAETLEPSTESDVYSLGCIAYELLTGQHPFAQHRDTESLAHAHAKETPAPHALVPQIVYDCLSKKPAERPSLESLATHFNDRSTRRKLRKNGRGGAVNGAAALISLGMPELALEVLEKIGGAEDSVLLNRAVALSQLHRFDEADELYQKLIASGKVGAIAQHAANLHRQGRSSEALALLEPLLAKGDASLGALVTASAALNDLNRHEEALTMVDKARQMDPGHTAVLFQRAYTLLKLRRCSAAKLAVGQLVALTGPTAYVDALHEQGRQICPKLFPA